MRQVTPTDNVISIIRQVNAILSDIYNRIERLEKKATNVVSEHDTPQSGKAGQVRTIVDKAVNDTKVEVHDGYQWTEIDSTGGS
jgi:hypothetical protein